MALDDEQSPLVFGEVLFDRFADGDDGRVTEVLGGAPFNVAWHLHAFGHSPRFISRVGDDSLGHRIRHAMQEHGMDQRMLQEDPVHPTGTVEVSLSDGEPSYDIVAERAYDFIDAAQLPPVSAGGLLYHGTLAARSPVSAAALAQLRAADDRAVFVDVNLRDPWWSAEQVLASIDGATWVKLNADELTTLTQGGRQLDELAGQFVTDHGLSAVFVTLGADGALMVDASGQRIRLPPPRVEVFVDAVGAGDGFASVLILGLLRHWPLEQTLQRAQAFASAIVGQRGATSRDPAFYRGFLSEWADP